ncbi:hypothetical protein [Streptomyces sp. NBC_01565]|uniref:hypothetical protein n=1 Tax=unclassified Streptomyces TaxID=2593676 RepID=UPI002258C812|nr:hypothetical protein [Streptomyces sp. NBC_01565]MCX4546345.1 hypothetical protein [Streptomyces sp. NBC_01565]
MHEVACPDEYHPPAFVDPVGFEGRSCPDSFSARRRDSYDDEGLAVWLRESVP